MDFTPPRTIETLACPCSPKRIRGSTLPFTVKVWLNENAIPLHKLGHTALLLRRRGSVFERSITTNRAVVDLYDDVVVKRRTCTSSSHGHCGPRCLETRVRDRSFLKDTSGVLTPELLHYYAEYDDGQVDIVSIQLRGLPVTPSAHAKADVLRLVARVGEAGIVHGDIRWTNIVTFNDVVMLIDWECAVRIGVDEELCDMGAQRPDSLSPDEWLCVDVWTAQALSVS